MVRCVTSLLSCAIALVALASFTGCTTNKAADAGACGLVTCPTGCNVSSDCLSCIPESSNAGAGTPCTTTADCCTGSCLNPSNAADAGICGGGGGSSSSGGSSSGSSGSSSSGAGNVAVGGTCSASADCSSDYCSGGVCKCNSAHPASPYTCKGPTDCCTGTTCTSGHCVAAASGCQAWTSTPNPGYDTSCNPDGGTADVCGPTGTCIPNCTVSAGYCAAGQTCNANGHCATATSSSSSGSSSGGSSSSGSGTGSSSSGTSGGTSSSGSSGSSSGACPTVDATQFGRCADAGTTVCGAGLTCTYDTVLGRNDCEYACTTSSQCDDVATVCNGHFCTINFCGPGANPADGGSLNGSPDGKCNAAGTGDGTCFPIVDPDAGYLYSLCIQGGSAGANATCNPAAERCSGAAVNCSAGAACLIAAAGDTSGNCFDTCVPTGTNSCTGGTCTDLGDGYTGYCPSSSSSSGGTSSSSSSGGSSSGSSHSSSSSSGSSGSSSSGSSSGSLPGDTCADCVSTSCTGATDFCVYDPTDTGMTGGNYCAPDCTNQADGGPDQTLCTGGTQCQSATDQFGSFSDYVCYPASGTCAGSSSGGSCSPSGDHTGAGGAACAQATDCCSQYCHATVSTCACNGAPHVACTVANEATICNPGGAAESAGGVCQNGLCAYPCVTDADCCTTGTHPSTGCGASGYCL